MTNAHAKDIGSTSCSSADVQAAIDAAADGDRVLIPAGSCTWSSQITSSNKAITIQGAGIDKTIITDNYSSGSTIMISLPATGTFYLTGITFDMAGLTGSYATLTITATTDNTSAFRLHHIKVLNQWRRWVIVQAAKYELGGLIDHMYVETYAGKWLDTRGGGPQTHAQFSRGLTLGTDKFVFIEDCEIDNRNTSAQIDGFNDAYSGSRYVFRHNTMTGCPAEMGGHGADSGGYRGTHSFEIYNNTFTRTLSCSYTTRAIHFRSGTGVVYNNTWSAGYTTMTVTNYRSTGSYAPWGQCDGSSIWDENKPGQSGYACLDQIGHIFGPASGGANTLEPLYEWNNTINGADADFVVTAGAQAHVQAGRDFYNDTPRPRYTPFTYPHPLVAGPSSPPPAPSPPPPADTTPPIMSNASVGNITSSSAVVTWTTNEPGDSLVRYGVTVAYASQSTLDASLATAHSVNISGLSPGTLYHYRMESRDAAGNLATSADFTFTTSPTQPPPSGRAHFVHNATGSNCNDTPAAGSEANPWCTITYAVSQMAGGDDLYVKSGTYNGPITITNLSGTSSDRTIIQVYPGHSVTLLGTGYSGGRIKITGSDFLTFDGFTITNFNQGIFVEGDSDYVVVQNCTVHDVGQEGIHVHGNSDHVTIDQCTIYDTGKWIYNGEGIYIGTGSSGPSDNTGFAIIRNNVIHDTKEEAIELKPGTHDALIEGNRIYSATTSPNWQSGWGTIEVNQAVSGQQSWASDPNHIIRNNFVHNSKTAMRVGTGGTVYNNVIYNVSDSSYGIYADNSAGDRYTRRIYHNTVDVPASRAIVVVSASADVRNNIGPATAGNLATADSLYLNKTGGDYHLAAGAAALNAGADLVTIVRTDIEGTSRTASPPPDLGAYERSEAQPPLPPTNLNAVPGP